jgi:putative nucleotidyltransferase with HDIG domain
MKIRFSEQQKHHITRIAMFTFVAIITVALMPNGNKFKYQFEVGKPWTYGLITASFDFPIYKSDQQVALEKSELLKDFSPYYKLDATVSDLKIAELTKAWQSDMNASIAHINYTRDMLKRIYSTGIISIKEYNNLIKSKRKNITCIYPNRVTGTIPVSSLYTPRTAYETIIANAPGGFKPGNLNQFLIENLKFDSSTSAISKSDILKNLSLTAGMVQVGERIIGPGEIVTPSGYQMLSSLKAESAKRNNMLQKTTLVVIGEIVLVFGLMALLFLYIYLFRARLYDSKSNLILILLLQIMLVSVTSIAINLNAFNFYMIPFALLPIIIRVFFDSRTALFAHMITTLIISLMVDNGFQFLLIQIAIGMAAVSTLKDMSQRSQLVQTAAVIFLCYAGMYLAFEFMSEGDINRVNWEYMIYFAISSVFLLMAYIFIYIFEKVFNLVSSVTLVELTNINSDLMLEFSERAPGTFQHSLQVSSLATEAAKKINANSLLVRTGALYHDIGKMKHPEYFIENQIGGKNPLTEIDFEVASQIVINHVTDGVEIGRRFHLPEQIINFIGTHHGFCKTKYFYNSYCNAHPDLKPNDAVFTYPGPLPNNKETAILMMADAVEARSRSLEVYSDQSISDMVESMIDSQIADGQFKDAPITFQDVETVKSVFKEKLKSFYHSRIVYPELNKAL